MSPQSYAPDARYTGIKSTVSCSTFPFLFLPLSPAIHLSCSFYARTIILRIAATMLNDRKVCSIAIATEFIRLSGNGNIEQFVYTSVIVSTFLPLLYVTALPIQISRLPCRRTPFSFRFATRFEFSVSSFYSEYKGSTNFRFLLIEYKSLYEFSKEFDDF